MSDPTEERDQGLAATDAHGDDAGLEVAPDEVLGHPQREDGVADDRDGLRGERLVELDGVDVSGRRAGLLEQRVEGYDGA